MNQTWDARDQVRHTSEVQLPHRPDRAGTFSILQQATQRQALDPGADQMPNFARLRDSVRD